jgi:hypothetical protein
MTSFADRLYTPRAQAIQQGIALVVIAASVAALIANVGLPPTVIVGASAMVGFLCWRKTNLRQPITPERTAILFLVTTAALHVHMYEEFTRRFGPAMSRLFAIRFTDTGFLRIFVFILPVVYYVTAIGLLLRVPLAGFFAWFIFIGPGVAEFTHFLFPLISPALEPSNPAPISATIHGVLIPDMENHHLSGRYYFPGLYTAILPMIPGIYSIRWLFKHRTRRD